MNLAGDSEPVGGGASVGHDAFDEDLLGVDQRREDGGHGALDVAHLDGSSVEHPDRVLVVEVRGLSDQAHQLSAVDSSRVVL